MNIRTLAIATGLHMISVAAMAQADQPFRDVPQDHWAYQAVENLRQKGILQGYPDAGYKGKRTITRYETAEALNRIALGLSHTVCPAGQMGDRGPAGPKGPGGPQGEQGPRGVPPPEVAHFRAALEEMRKEIGATRQQLEAADLKVGPLTEQTRELKKDASPVRTGK